MNNYLHKVIFAFAVYLALFSCNLEDKTNNEQQTTGKAYKDTTVVLTRYKLQQNVQTFEINTKKQQTIRGKQGTEVTFPLDCFNKVKGKVKIELIECYSIQDMILNGLSTETTDGKLLESDGMIYLNALNEIGDTLEIKQGKIKVQMPTEDRKTGIQIFEGVGNSKAVTWNLSRSVLISQNNKSSTPNNEGELYADGDDFLHQAQFKKEDSQIIIDKQIKNEFLINYVFSISKMGWINCDRYIEGETSPLIVNVPKESIGASYYLVLKNYNSSVPPRSTKNGTLSFMIPVNEPYTIVALSSKGDDIYFNMMDYTGEKSEVDFSELESVARQELTDLLLEKFGKDIWSRPRV